MFVCGCCSPPVVEKRFRVAPPAVGGIGSLESSESKSCSLSLPSGSGNGTSHESSAIIINSTCILYFDSRQRAVSDDL